MGLGYNYKKGVSLAGKEYVLMVPGDRDILPKTFDLLFKKIDIKDIILAYTANLEIRPWTRQIVSKTFTALMNFLFGMHLRYFNGIVIHKRSIIQSIPIQTDGFAYQAEALIQLIRAGYTYEEVPQWIRERQYGKSKAFHPANIFRVLKTIAQLFYQIRLKKQYVNVILKNRTVK
jgi:hypothetical protein